jgi:hypothetical protein
MSQNYHNYPYLKYHNMENNFNIFGIDVAIKKLRPNAKFVISNRDFIQWEDELPPPTWEEIENQISLDKTNC